MSNYAISLKRSTALAAALAFTATLLAFNFASIFSANVGAAQVAERSLTLSSSLPGDETGDLVAGSETNGADAIHTVRFNANVSSASVTLTYCQEAIGTCNAPVGLNITAAAAGALTNASGTISDTGNVLTLSGGVTTGANTPTVITITDVVNPTAVGTFFIRIASGTDEGTVASSITEGIVITSRVAETLGFSTTADMTTSGVVPEDGDACDPLEGSGAIQLGDPSNEYTLNISTAFDAQSAFRLYTNSALGTVVQYDGKTLTKGTDEIEPIPAAAVSAPGTEQFGLAIDATGGSVTNADTTFGGTGQLDLIADYANGAGAINGTPDAEFLFLPETPTTIATSATNDQYVSCDTAVVRYLANISPLTPAGTYTTTIVYSAVPTY